MGWGIGEGSFRAPATSLRAEPPDILCGGGQSKPSPPPTVARPASQDLRRIRPVGRYSRWPRHAPAV